MTGHSSIISKLVHRWLKLFRELFIPGRLLLPFKEEFRKYAFKKNNFRTFIISLFLFFEQLIYAFFFSNESSVQQKIFFFTSAVMVIYLSISLMKIKRRPAGISFFHKIFSTSIVWFGFTIACHRFLILDFTDFHLPTVYLAVLYGGAVLFYMSYIESLILYSALAAVSIYLTPVFHPGITGTVYMADITSNVMIACFIACLNYSGLMKDFLNNKFIQEKNSALLQNNREIANMNSKLVDMSLRDPLTGLFNRRKVDDILIMEEEKGLRENRDFSLIIFDLDFFKEINDRHGHTAGDDTLKELSILLKNNLREKDLCARWGGEEFIILCLENDLNHAADLANRLREKISSNIFSHGIRITASFGIASFKEFRNAEDMIKNADNRLYKAKGKGRNTIVFQS